MLIIEGRVTVPPSRPNRNSTRRRLRGSRLGKISSVKLTLSAVFGGLTVALEVEEELAELLLVELETLL